MLYDKHKAEMTVSYNQFFPFKNNLIKPAIIQLTDPICHLSLF
jgi:hypothetical protein